MSRAVLRGQLLLLSLGIWMYACVLAGATQSRATANTRSGGPLSKLFKLRGQSPPNKIKLSPKGDAILASYEAMLDGWQPPSSKHQDRPPPGYVFHIGDLHQLGRYHDEKGRYGSVIGDIGHVNDHIAWGAKFDYHAALHWDKPWRIVRALSPGTGEVYFNAFHPAKGKLVCANNYKGKRDETPPSNQATGSQDYEPAHFSDVLFHSYDMARKEAGFSAANPGPPLQWILRYVITKPPTFQILERVFKHFPSDDPKYQDKVKIFNYTSPAAKIILADTPHGRGILRLLTDHAPELGQRRIEAMALRRHLYERVNFDDEDGTEPMFHLKIKLVDAHQSSASSRSLRQKEQKA